MIDILDTPPRSKGGDGPGSSKGNVASIFASRKRVKLEDKPEAEDIISQQSAGTNDRKRAAGRDQTGKGEVMEKKPRVNPLTANQP